VNSFHAAVCRAFVHAPDALRPIRGRLVVTPREAVLLEINYGGVKCIADSSLTVCSAPNPLACPATDTGCLVLVAGYMLGALTAVLTALAFWFGVDSVVLLAVIFFVAGLYIAVQEALESTVAAEMVQAETFATSVGALDTVNGTAKFILSMMVGVLWTVISPAFSFALAALLMGLGTLALLRCATNRN
jgi:hypothetical protein